MTKRRHKHRWSKPYNGFFKGPVRLCLAGRCGGMRHSTGHIVYMMERVQK